MRKIPTLFQRNHDGDHLVRDEVTPGCEWVLAGEGVATQKLDGTCCQIKDGKLYKRRELKSGATIPEGYLMADIDLSTGKITGWVPVGDGPEDGRHRTALEFGVAANGGEMLSDGTYELIGPGIQKNPERLEVPYLCPHKAQGLILERFTARTFAAIRDDLDGASIEGIVWHHPDGRMAKIKLRDFGLTRP